MPNKFVLDAALLEKYSSDEPDSIPDIFQKLVDNGKCNWQFCEELHSFIEILEAVTKGKALICLNERVIQEYMSYLNKIPPEILEYISTILSSDSCSFKDEKGGLKGEDIREIKNTSLKCKEVYLDIAKILTKRTIVTTKEDKDNVYSFRSNNLILLKHGIACRYTWEHWDEIKSRI